MTVVAGPPRVRRALPGGRGAGERGQLGRIPLDLWVALAGDAEARARYYRKVLAALAEDASAGEIEAAIEHVSAAGIPGAQQVLF